MKILHPGVGTGHQIDQFGSHGAYRVGMIRFSGDGALTFLNLRPGGHLGRHAAPTAQLFCITQGVGWVAGDDGLRATVKAGDGALWQAGEEHESGTESGIVVVILEVARVHQ